MITFFKTIIYIPLYNILILILNVDWIDAGMAAVILTVLVKFILYPLTKKAIFTQTKMKEKEAELLSIKEKYKDKQEQALKVMDFYRKNNISPFSSIATILIQIPVIYSLYYIFLKSGLPNIDTELLYPFIKVPGSVSMVFLGFIDISQKSLFLAALAAVSTYIQMHLSSTKNKNVQGGKPNITKTGLNTEDFTSMMAKQMKYTMPIIVLLVSWKISGVIALYWFISNTVGILQDMYVRKQLASNPQF